MAKNLVIGGTLQLNGAPEYNQRLREVTTELKSLQAAMKLNDEEFKGAQNSVEALSKKSEILAKQYEMAGEKVRLYSARLEEMRAAEEQAAAKVEEYRTKLSEAQHTLEDMKNSGTATDSMLKEQADVVQNLEKELAGAEKQLSTTIVKENQLEAALNNATAEELRYGTQLQQTNGYLAEAQSSTDGLAHSIDGYGKEVDQAAEKTAELVDTLDKVRKNEAFEALGEGAKKVLETMMECAEVAENFEYSMAKVQSIAKVSGSELDSMSAEIRRVAVDMGYGASEIAEATYQAISASVDASEAISFVEDASQLARAGFTEVTTAVDVLTTAINAYGAEANTTAHIADDLITTQNLGKTTVDQLAQSLGTIIPTASAYGVSLDQLSSAYVILTRNGVNTANATTYLRGMLNELGDSGSDVSEILYNETGHSFGELMKQGYSLGDVLEIVGNQVDGNTEQFANLFGNIRAGQGAMNIFNEGAEDFNRILGEMENNAGATDEAFQTMADTALMTNERFEASIENLKIALGETLSPTIENLKENAIGALEPVTEFIEEHPELVQALTFVAVGIAGVTAAVSIANAALVVMNALMGNWGKIAIAAAAGAAVGLGAYAFSLDGVHSETEKLTESTKESTNALIDNWHTLKQLQTDHSATAAKIKELRDRFAELTKEDITNAEVKKELIAVIAQLNELVPGLNIAYENLTTGVDGNTDAVLANIDALTEQNELQQKQEQMAELEQTITEATEKHAEAEENLNKVLEEKAELEKQQAQYLEENGQLNMQYQNSIDELTAAERAYREEKHTTSHILDEATEKYDQLSTSVSNLTEAQEENEQAARAEAEAQEAAQKALEEASKAIESQVSLMERMNDQAKLTFGEMYNNIEPNTESLNRYSENLDKAAGILNGNYSDAVKRATQEMVDLNDAAQLDAFISGFEELAETGTTTIDGATVSLEEYEKALEEYYATYDETIRKYAEEHTDVEDTYYDELTTKQTDYFTTKNDNQATQNEEEIQTATEHKDALIQIATDTVDGMALAITTEADTKVKEAINHLAQTTVIDTTKQKLEIIGDDLKSQVFVRIGRDGICGGLAQGIQDGTATVVAAIQNLVDTVVASVDVDAIVDAVDKKLGEKVGE